MDTGRLNRFLWLGFCLLLGLLVLVYLALGLNASAGRLRLPLDDSYIHLQYARQMAAGQPFIYNPGDAPTSGATSLLYTPLLALGSLFFPDDLSPWALLIGVLSFAASGWLLYRLLWEMGLGLLVTLLMTCSFLCTGAFVWAALSGMETLLFCALMLLTLYTYQLEAGRAALLAGSLAALLRPEGAVIALTLALVLAWGWRRQPSRWPLLLLPLLAIGLQPLLVYLLTGTSTATGNQAKSHLYNLTVPLAERLQTVAEFWLRLWRELLTGQADTGVNYVPVLLILLALAGAGRAAWESWQQRRIKPGLLALLWLLLLSIGIASLDTAFWHFKRYQVPLMVLCFPLAGEALAWAGQQARSQAARPLLLVAALLLGFTLPTTLQFASYYAHNIQVLEGQQMAMLAWTEAHLPEGARIGVHDVGVLRYFGTHPTYDVVGLTTPNTALAWRQGPGVVYETMRQHPQRPDYFAIYPDVAGLPMLVEAGVLGRELARFTVDFPPQVVVSATETQVISQADWASLDDEASPQLPVMQQYLAEARLLGSVNVAQPASEAAADYHWWNRDTPEGFASEVRHLPYAACAGECRTTDGARRLTGGERFTLPPLPAGLEEYRVVGRYHAAFPALLHLGCADARQTYVIPALPGQWTELLFTVRAGEDFCVASEGFYIPAHYWVYGAKAAAASLPEARAEFADPAAPERAALLLSLELTQDAEALHLRSTWGSLDDLTQDGKVFVHLYADLDSPPLAQAEFYVAGLPPADWLAGIPLEASTLLSLADLPPGDYSLALGIYNPITGERYPASGEGAAGDRLIVGHIRIPE